MSPPWKLLLIRFVPRPQYLPPNAKKRIAAKGIAIKKILLQGLSIKLLAFFLPNARPLLNNKPVRPNAIPIRISGITVLNDNSTELVIGT